MSTDRSQIGENLEEIRTLLNIAAPEHETSEINYAWYVGATGNDENGEYTDFSDKYIAEGRWENGWDDKFIDDVKNIKIGDRIALKSSYTKKKNLPFNNNGKTVGVMGIKAIGIVTENVGDGKNIKVDWKKTEPLKEWYGKGVLRQTVHLVNSTDGLTKKLLLKFTFANHEQDYSLVEEQYSDDETEKTDEVEIYAEENNELSLEELGRILSDMYNSPSATGKVTAIHMFCVKYGKQLRSLNCSSAEITAAAGLNDSYQSEITKGLRIYDSINSDEYGVNFGIRSGISEPDVDLPGNSLPVLKPRTNLLHNLNRILYGAPGTGKTYATVELSVAVVENRPVNYARLTDEERVSLVEKYNDYVEEGKIVFTTFHQNYGYEDFIQGLRPDTKKEGIAFKNVDGVFKRLADIAIDDPANNYVIIIDEINRANISKVFGELITLIEEDKRWGEKNQTSVTLPSGTLFAIPNNLYIIGTMNSSDKSISLIDAALRRRFVFVEQKPDESLIADVKLRQLFEKINTRLVNDLSSTDLLIGHSYFIGKSWDVACQILNNSIIPLLYEYYYDNRKKVAGLLGDVLKDSDIVISDEKYGRLQVKKNG